MSDVTTVRIPGNLTGHINEADTHLSAGNKNLVLDFSGCNFISVEGLEWLEEFLLRAQSSAADIKLENVIPSIYKVFKVARIDNVLRACGAPLPSGPAC